MAAMAMRAIQNKLPNYTPAQVSKDGFCDIADLEDWALDAMLFAFGAGILRQEENYMLPDLNPTRADAAMAIFKLLEILME
jgi:hypothetical protein